MDELTTLRVLADHIVPPTADTLARGRGALEQLIADTVQKQQAVPVQQRSEPHTSRQGARAVRAIRASGAHRTRSDGGHPFRTAFIALGGIAATALVATVLVTNSLGIASWQPNGVSAPSSPTASAQAEPATFAVPVNCAEVVGTSILPEWSPRFGQADELTQLSRAYSNSDDEPSGLHCVYGSNEDNRILSLDVRALDAVPGAREEADNQVRTDGQSGYDVTEEAAGDGTLFVTTKRGDYVEVAVTLVTDTAVVSVGALGTEQRPAELMPFLRQWLDDLVARTGADS